MLHGHTKIELKNEKTGEVQVVEKDNMITNALAKQLEMAPLLGLQTINDLYTPLNDNGMGGILLFENPIEENANNFKFTSQYNNPLIGYASNTVTSGKDTKQGSRNLTESQKLVNGYKYVWDFATSEANGQISALALTHKNLAVPNRDIAPTVINISNGRITPEGYNELGNATEVDWENNIITCIVTTTSNPTSGNSYIKKIKLHLTDLSINNTILKTEIISSDILPKAPTDITWFSGDTNYYYGTHVSDTNISIYRMDKQTHKISSSPITTVTMPSNNSVIDGCILNNYIYLARTPIESQPKTLYLAKVNIKDFNDVVQSTIVSSSILGRSPSLSCFVPDKDCIHAGPLFIYPDLTWSYRRTTYTFIASSDRKRHFVNPENNFAIELVYDSDYYWYITIFANYLATINNLDTPVTKTSEQSMKITYTITEE